MESTTCVTHATRDAQQAAACALVEAKVPRVDLVNLIRFQSGIWSPFYMDCRLVPGHPASYKAMIEVFRAQTAQYQYDAIAGIQTGAIPFSAVLAFHDYRYKSAPHFSIRKEAKEHGTGKLIEGGDPKGMRVLVVEDMITTATSVMDGVLALRAAGAVIVGCVAIMSYNFPNKEGVRAHERFANEKVPLRLLTSLPAILERMRLNRAIQSGEEEAVLKWYREHSVA